MSLPAVPDEEETLIEWFRSLPIIRVTEPPVPPVPGHQARPDGRFSFREGRYLVWYQLPPRVDQLTSVVKERWTSRWSFGESRPLTDFNQLTGPQVFAVSADDLFIEIWSSETTFLEPL
jgi:hypothetical protein